VLRRRTTCPRCHKPWAKEELRREVVGTFRKDIPLDGLPAVPHVKYRLFHRCRECGYQWYSSETRRLWQSWFS